MTATLVGAVAAIVAAAGCTEVDEGRPVAEPSGSAVTVSRTLSPSASSAPDMEPPGILATQRAPIPAGAVTCSPEARPPVSVAAAVADPAAPRVVVGVPDGWNFTGGTGDAAVTMQGPQGLSASVTISPTALDPASAFREYTDTVMEQAAISTVSILPAQLCDYSGQKLTGTWADEPESATEFYDRVVHVWTNTGDYLIAIHIEGPAAPESGLETAGATITDNLELTIP